MSSKILIKRSTTTGAIPTTADLDTGEFAVNTVDKRIFTNNQGTIVELGTTPSTQAVAGNATVGGTFAVTGATTLSTGSTTGNFSVAGTLQLDTEGTASNHVVTKAYVDTAISDLVDGAGSALDTLKELADAINNDANFATTITNSIATKLSKSGDTMTGNLNMGSNKVTSSTNPTADDDLTRKGYVDTILGSATAAATSASEAATSASNAATSEANASASATSASSSASSASSSATSASASATSASTSASSASTSASQASTSASNAATSATNAENAFDSFDDRYLGAKASDPTLDNDGDALLEGALYFNTTNDRMFVYTGSAWSAVSDVEALYNSGNLKLATTSTGVDVTGTVTADGLNVGDIAANNYSGLSGLSNMGVENADVYGYSAAEGGLVVNAKYESGWKHTQSDVATRYTQVNGDHRFYSADSGVSGATANFREVLKLDNTGDVSFYEDTGTTAKMVWDASEENFLSTGAPLDGSMYRGSYNGTLIGMGIGNNETYKPNYMGTNEAGLWINDTSKTVDMKFSLRSSGDFVFRSGNNPNEKMRIDSSGNVGIGTSSPSTQLNVGHASHGVGIAYAGGTLPSLAGIYTSSDASHGQAYGSLVIQARGDYSGYGITFRSSNSEQARIDSSGNLLVGKTSADGGTDGFEARNGGYTYVTANDINGALFVRERNTSNSGSRKVVVITGGTFNTADNTSDLIEFRRGDGTAIGTVQRSGSNGVSYVTSSDYRLKENIESIDNASSRVLALKPCRFNFIDAPDTTVDGFIAHEAQEVVPEAVTGIKDAVDSDGNPKYQGIDQSKLVPLLTKALQEALTEIDSLKQRVDALENN